MEGFYRYNYPKRLLIDNVRHNRRDLYVCCRAATKHQTLRVYVSGSRGLAVFIQTFYSFFSTVFSRSIMFSVHLSYWAFLLCHVEALRSVE